MKEKKMGYIARMLAAASIDLGGLALGMVTTALVAKAMKPVKTPLPKWVDSFGKSTLMAMTAFAVTYPTTFLAFKVAAGTPTIPTIDKLNTDDLDDETAEEFNF